MLVQTTESLNELLTPSCRKASEHTAAAALTELRNNSNHLHLHPGIKPHQPPKSQIIHHQQQPTLAATTTNNQQSSLVTSILSKNHINHLEANSVSVIPIETTNKQTNNRIQQPPTTIPIIEMRNLTQLQQQLETAAVLMDISKKVIISPPSSNPQSPSVLDQTNNQYNKQQQQQQKKKQQQPQQQSITSTVINLKRSKSNEEMDLSIKRIKEEPQEEPQHPPSLKEVRKSFPATDLTVIKRRVIDDHHAIDELSQQSDSNDSSDPGRLQMDINSQEALEIEETKMKNNIYNNCNSRQQIVDSGRETPDSLKSSEDHATDPATTQLWQALATGNYIFFLHFKNL